MCTYQMTTDPEVAVHRLSQEPFPNLMTLKMLTLHPEACRTVTLSSGSDWSCLTELDVAASHWDRRAYPPHDTVVFLDGSSEGALQEAIDRAPRRGSVFKVHHDFVRSRVASFPGAKHTQTYLSYTVPAAYVPASVQPVEVAQSSEPTAEALACFAGTGYTPEEVADLFGRGATWFGATVQGRCVSACLVYPNYQRIWEIGGVYTHPEFRRKGYARAAVQAALAALCGAGRTPRYQLRDDNTPSRAVAESLGLRLALTAWHYTTAPRS